MYKFSNISLKRLENVHPDLVKVLKEAIIDSPYDFAIVQGSRTLEEQKELFKKGRTTKGQIVTNCDGVVKKSKHQIQKDNYAHAIDFGIYNDKVVGNIEWGNLNKIRQVVNHIKTVAAKYGVKIVWGGDWQDFKDYPHIELRKDSNANNPKF